MTLIEFLGFVIVLIAMGLIMAKRAYDEYQRRKHPEKYAEEERQKDEAMREFLRSLDIEVESEEEAESIVYSTPPPPSKRSVEDAFTFERPLEERHPSSAVEERVFSVSLDDRYQTTRKRVASPNLGIPVAKDAYLLEEKTSIAKKLIQKRHLRDAIVLREILGPPKHEQL